MAIRFLCPTCGARYSVPEKLAGKKSICVKCKTKFEVPAKSTIPPEKARTGAKKSAKSAALNIKDEPSDLDEPPMASAVEDELESAPTGPSDSDTADGNPFDFFDGSIMTTVTPSPKPSKKKSDSKANLDSKAKSKPDPKADDEDDTAEEPPNSDQEAFDDTPMDFSDDEEPVPMEEFEEFDESPSSSSSPSPYSIPVPAGRREIIARLPEKLVEAFSVHAAKERRTLEAEIEIAMEERLMKFDRWKPED